MYNPHSTRYKYPDFTDQHYLVVKKNNGAVFDESYPYIDNSKQPLLHLQLNLIFSSKGSSFKWEVNINLQIQL